MSVTKHLFEAASLVGDSASEDGTWKVRLISEGKGSSGTYTADLLENHHHALDDVLSFTNHPGDWEGPQARDLTMIAGEIVGETWTEKDDRGLVAVYGNYRPDPEYRGKIERYKNKLGVSIYIEGSGYMDESGEFIVDWFNPEDPYASLDVVIAAGARGRFEESMREMYQKRSEKTSVALAEEKSERKAMTMEKDVEERFSAIESLIQSLVDAKHTEAQAKADDAAVQAEADKRVEAIVASLAAVESARADLLPSQVASITESAKRGEDVAPAIESAKAIAAEAREAFGKTNEVVETGRLGESSSTSEYKLTGFGA